MAAVPFLSAQIMALPTITGAIMHLTTMGIMAVTTVIIITDHITMTDRIIIIAHGIIVHDIIEDIVTVGKTALIDVILSWHSQ